MVFAEAVAFSASRLALLSLIATETDLSIVDVWEALNSLGTYLPVATANYDAAHWPFGNFRWELPNGCVDSMPLLRFVEEERPSEAKGRETNMFSVIFDFRAIFYYAMGNYTYTSLIVIMVALANTRNSSKITGCHC